MDIDVAYILPRFSFQCFPRVTLSYYLSYSRSFFGPLSLSLSLILALSLCFLFSLSLTYPLSYYLSLPCSRILAYVYSLIFHLLDLYFLSLLCSVLFFHSLSLSLVCAPLFLSYYLSRVLPHPHLFSPPLSSHMSLSLFFIIRKNKYDGDGLV